MPEIPWLAASEFELHHGFANYLGRACDQEITKMVRMIRVISLLLPGPAAPSGSRKLPSSICGQCGVWRRAQRVQKKTLWKMKRVWCGVACGMQKERRNQRERVRA